MKQVIVKIVGQELRSAVAETLGQLRETLGIPTRNATVNGETADNDYEFQGGEFVAFSEKVDAG